MSKMASLRARKEESVLKMASLRAWKEEYVPKMASLRAWKEENVPKMASQRARKEERYARYASLYSCGGCTWVCMPPYTLFVGIPRVYMPASSASMKGTLLPCTPSCCAECHF